VRLHQADTWGEIANKESWSPFLYYQSEGCRPERWQGSVSTVCHSWHQRRFNKRWEMLLPDTASCVSTLSLPDMTSQAFPSVFAYRKRSNTGGGNKARSVLLHRVFHALCTGSELMNQLQYKELAFPGPLTKFGLQYKVGEPPYSTTWRLLHNLVFFF